MVYLFKFLAMTKAMTKKKIPPVFMDVSIDGDPIERMVFEVLFILCLFITCAATFAIFNLTSDHCDATAFLRCCFQDCGKFSCTMYRYFKFDLD